MNSVKTFVKMMRSVAAIYVVLAGIAWDQAAFGQSAPQVRLLNPIKNEQRVTIEKTTSPLVSRSVDTGRLNGGQNLGRMILLLTPTAEQEQAAAKLVSDLHDASSTKFHKWLTPAQFGESYGAAKEDAGTVQNWLLQQGFLVHEVSQSNRFIVFSGTVSQVESAFATEMHSYQYNSKKFISNATDMQIPQALQGVVKGVVRLHSDPRAPLAYQGAKVHFKKTGTHFTFYDGSNYITPADFAKIYNVQPLYDAGIDGTGQSIAIVGRSNFSVQDVTDYRSLVGLPANDPVVIINGDDPGQLLGDSAEATLDVTWSGAIAPMAKIKFVLSQSNFSDGVDVSAAYIVDHNLAPVMSTSYGSCEDSLGPVGNAFYNALWQQAAAEGITSFVSAGDNGGAGCDAPGSGIFSSGGLAVNALASTPYNVAVGGTEFDDTDNPALYWNDALNNDPITGLSVLSYIPEKVWNQSNNDPNAVGLWAGSGGVSKIYSKPDWQAAAGVPNDGKRDLPDFSLTASTHDGYLICLYGYCSGGQNFFAFGGTSASSPSAAGIMALVNQKLGGQPQGIANYVFYKLSAVPDVYHDTIKGDNKVPDSLGQYTVGYSAGVGYDLATGIGSFDATALATNWLAASTAIGSTTQVGLGGGQSTTVMHGSPINVVATVTCSNGSPCTAPTGAVSLLATSATGGALGSGVGQLTPGGSTSTANIQTHMVPGGAMTITARYGGDGKYYASTSGPVNVTVTPEPSTTYVGIISGGYITNAPISISYGQPIPIGVAVAGNSGYGYPSGAMNLANDGQPIMPAKYDYNSGLWTSYNIVLNYGELSTIVTGGSSPTGESSSVSTLAPGIQAGQHQLLASFPGDNSFNASAATYTFNVTKSDSIIADFFTIGSVVVGVPVALAGQIVLGNNGCAPYGGTIKFTDITTSTPQVLAVGNVDQLYCDSYNVPVTFTTAGNHIIRVDYSGDKNVNPTFQIYNQFPVTANSPAYVTLAADLATVNAGSTITLTANVSSDVRQHLPTGSVSFLDGTTSIGAATIDASGNAVLIINTLAGGPHNITASYPGDSALSGSVSNAVLEQITDYTVQVFPASVTIRSGSTGTATFNLVPLGGFNQTVQLSYSPLPSNVKLTFSKSSVTLDGVNPIPVTVTITTNGTVATASLPLKWSGAMATIAFAGLLLPFGMRRKLRSAFFVLALLSVVFYGVACGSGSSASNAKPGTYTVTVTAVSGTGATALTKPTTLTINIVN
jgi:hypothetical protein